MGGYNKADSENNSILQTIEDWQDLSAKVSLIYKDNTVDQKIKDTIRQDMKYMEGEFDMLGITYSSLHQLQDSLAFAKQEYTKCEQELKTQSFKNQKMAIEHDKNLLKLKNDSFKDKTALKEEFGIIIDGFRKIIEVQNHQYKQLGIQYEKLFKASIQLEGQKAIFANQVIHLQYLIKRINRDTYQINIDFPEQISQGFRNLLVNSCKGIPVIGVVCSGVAGMLGGAINLILGSIWAIKNSVSDENKSE